MWLASNIDSNFKVVLKILIFFHMHFEIFTEFNIYFLGLSETSPLGIPHNRQQIRLS